MPEANFESKVTHQKEGSFLEFMPVSLFGAVMGLTALCFAWRLASQLWRLGSAVPETIGVVAIVAFVVVTLAYLVKWHRYPESVVAEFDHPVSVAFFSTFIISLLLIPGILLPYAPALADTIWLLGVLLIFLFAWFVLRKWLGKQQMPESAMPAWVLPVTGTLNVPIVGSFLRFNGAHETSVMFFGIGILFIVMLMTMIFSRLFFQAQLTAIAEPSLMILAAPLALAFSGYEGLQGVQDLTASAFFYFCLFLLLLFGSKIFLLPRTCPFHVGWWSVSFPLASVTVASLRYSQGAPDVLHRALAGVLLAVTTLVILYLLVQTVSQIWSRRWKSRIDKS
ncbi:MAG TPA: SLAC1 anion channel family protein [Puia sp.]|jgi:tellurite resistance protein|uniref:SLAC1 anion channel family protein n=1 Tax=Puia sp. TaxID=2045100 RepID=UPI002BD2CFB4|nr:SLAC1 anion channel family protein [Puia sp.]HVU94412.1 SLAC1 anion channel family protein [Puia sp.]